MDAAACPCLTSFPQSLSPQALSGERLSFVVPAKAGTQASRHSRESGNPVLGPRLRGDDEKGRGNDAKTGFPLARE